MNKSTQELVKKAADELLQEGVKPTQQSIRERIGTGSITTINKALNSWWSELGGRLDEKNRMPDLPEPVLDSASKLWRQALGFARNELESERKSIQLQLSEQAKKIKQTSMEEHVELKELRSQCLRLLQDNEKLSKEKGDVFLKLAESENKLIASLAENSTLARELKQAELVSGGNHNLDSYIEMQVQNRTLQEENKRLSRAVDSLSQEKADMQLEILRLKQELSVS